MPHGTPEWGSDWKRATVKWYHHAARFNTQGSVYANRANFMDLDPTYKDALGRPLVRLTYNPPDNEFKMSAFLLSKLEGVIKAMNPTSYDLHPRPKTFTVVPYQSTHNTGGTMMGSDPKTSVVNRYLQSWDADNLFIPGRVSVSAAARFTIRPALSARWLICRPMPSLPNISKSRDRSFMRNYFVSACAIFAAAFTAQTASAAGRCAWQGSLCRLRRLS